MGGWVGEAEETFEAVKRFGKLQVYSGHKEYGNAHGGVGKLIGERPWLESLLRAKLAGET
jgi:hypothetical protein